MLQGSRTVVVAAALVAAAVLGGGVALGGAALLGDLGEHQTTVREVIDNSQPATPAAFRNGDALSINEIYRRAAPGVVQVTSTSVEDVPADPFTNPFGVPQQQTQRALGSGFVIDKAGHIITNYHVVQGARKVQVSFSSNDSIDAQVVGVDPSTDVAVLKVDAHARALTPLPLGDSDRVHVGDAVVAIGNPLGYNRSVTSGIVSAVQRPIEAPNQTATIDHAIQTDAALNHGNSGGPLLNAQGQVVGVNAQIAPSSSGENIGIGFAIPINTVRTVASQLIDHGTVEHAFLGIRAKEIDASVAGLFHLPTKQGLLVESVQPDSGAAKAGLRGSTQQVVVAGESWPLGGDIIVKADDEDVRTLADLRDVISSKKPGESLKLEVYRNEKKESMTVKLGRQPTSPR